jgi:ABC-type iron transport system FetAB permease component
MLPPTLVANPSWSQVNIAFALVAINSAISQVLELDVGASLVIAALRCMAQLFIVTFVLRYVLVIESMWAVARLARRFPTLLLQEREVTTDRFFTQCY